MNWTSLKPSLEPDTSYLRYIFKLAIAYIELHRLQGGLQNFEDKNGW